MSSKGFTFIEVISTLGILMLVSVSILPLLSEVRLYQNELMIERHAWTALHNHLLLLPEKETEYPTTITNTKYIPITLTFIQYNDLIKGCATWVDHQQLSKEVCLYADD